jgi:hypothetical protein
MDCKTARLLLDYARPTSAELDPGETAALEGHLAGCADCDAAARAERHLDDHLGRAVRDVPLPDGFRHRLLGRLAAERRAWYRRQRRRVAPFAAAAAVLLGLGLWRFWPRPNLPLPYPEAMVEYVSDNNYARQRAKDLEDWFHDKHPDRPMTAPREFEQRVLNYALLAYADLADFQGQRVPMLLFTSGNKQARVYVLSTRQFNLDELKRDQPTMDSKGYTVAVRLCPDDPNLVYIFIYTGNSMAPFVTGPPPPVG